jgi:hypothetical protein
VLPYVQQGQQQAAAAFNPYQQIGNAALGTLYQRLGMRAPATGPAMPGQQLPFQAQPATMPPQMASTPWQAMTHPGQPAQYGIQPGMMPQGGFNLYGTGPR